MKRVHTHTNRDDVDEGLRSDLSFISDYATGTQSK
jgi:hypothetical protein